MTPDELAQAVRRARRPRDDGEMVHVAAQVGGELRGRPISPRAVFFERTHRDPVEITSQLARHAGNVRTLALRRLHAHGLHRRRTRTKRLDFAKRPADLVDALPEQRLRVERQTPGQELVEDDAERINVRSGVDIETRHLGLLAAHVLGRTD